MKYTLLLVAALLCAAYALKVDDGVEISNEEDDFGLIAEPDMNGRKLTEFNHASDAALINPDDSASVDSSGRSLLEDKKRKKFHHKKWKKKHHHKKWKKKHHHKKWNKKKNWHKKKQGSPKRNFNPKKSFSG